jgi:hypothetical protein
MEKILVCELKKEKKLPKLHSISLYFILKISTILFGNLALTLSAQL